MGQLVRIMYVHVPVGHRLLPGLLRHRRRPARMYLWKRTEGWDPWPRRRPRSAWCSPPSPCSPARSGATPPGAPGGSGTPASPARAHVRAVPRLPGPAPGDHRSRRRGPSSPPCSGIIAFVNVPIVHYSVDWWRSLHQTATVSQPRPHDRRARLFALFSGWSWRMLLYVWLLIHRFRLQFAAGPLEAKGLDVRPRRAPGRGPRRRRRRRAPPRRRRRERPRRSGDGHRARRHQRLDLRRRHLRRHRRR